MSATTSANTGTSTLACVRCHRLGARNCSLCRSVAYCSTACQKKDWEFGHKIQCKEIRLKQQQQQQPPTAALGGGATNGVVNGIEKLSLNRTPSSGGVSEVDEESQLAYSSPTLSPPNRWLVTPTDIGTLCTARSRMPPKPVGLLNPKKANSCFYNVVLQTLTYTKPFINLIDQLQHTPEKCVLASQSKFCMICTFQHHREQVLKHSRDAVGDIDPTSTVPIVPPQPNGEPKPILPVALLRNLDKLSSDYALGQQEDSHDTLKNLLHVWDEAWIKNYANATSSSSSSSTDVISPLPRLSQRTLETTPISQLFGGYLLSEIKCETGGCRKFTSRFEFFLDLSLEIIQETDDLGEMLEAFSRPEKLDAQNLYKCSYCEKKSRARKQITIFQQPNILMIQLKRFRMGMFGKVNKYIKFPLELSLRKYMSGCKIAADDELLKKDLSATSELSVVYRLYAVIVHLDLMNVSSFGHYICFIRDPNSTKDEWFKFDDDTIERVSTAQVLKLNAYILFYQRSTPFVSKEEVSNETESTDSVSSSVQPSVSSSPVSSPDSATSAGDGSISSPVPPPVSDAPVQCVGGCGFWGKASTENRCSQCYRKWQEDQGLIPKSQPKPKPQEDDDDEEVTPAMQLLHNRRALAQIDSNPALQARLLTDTAFRAQVTQLRAQVAAQMSAINPSLASNGTTNSIGGGFLSDSSFAQQLRQQMENQRRLESMQREQLIASQSAQLPPNPVETKSSKAATEAPTAKVGRNDKCPCGSGRKFKVCHGKE